jgi:phosphatidylglycerol---prolipoprotein diacylglyceryl transferase
LDEFFTRLALGTVLKDGFPMEGCKDLYCRELIPGVFPTPMYETMMCIVVFAILWALRKRIKVAGVIFFIYLILNGLERFIIETIRVNPRYDVMGFMLSQAQIIALGLVGIGLLGASILMVKANKNKHHKTI